MKENNKNTINKGRQMSATLRNYFDEMTTLQLRQFFKSSDEEALKKILRNLLWAMDQKQTKSLEEELEAIQLKVEINKKSREGRDKQLANYL